MATSHGRSDVRRLTAKSARRTVTVVALSAVAIAAMASPAFANWTSSISGASTGFQSHRWADQSDSEVKFTGCSDTGTKASVDVDLQEDINNWPDTDYGTKTFTNCFNAWDATSAGHWSGLDDGNYYFEIGVTGFFAASPVCVDTTSATDDC